MTRTVAIIAALDTKGEEAKLIRDYVAGQGLGTLVIDCGVLDQPTIPADVSRGEVAAAGGDSIESLQASRDKARAMDAMTRGAAIVAGRLYQEGCLDGIVG